jgi:hypothetical protein
VPLVGMPKPNSEALYIQPPRVMQSTYISEDVAALANCTNIIDNNKATDITNKLFFIFPSPLYNISYF